MVKYNLKDCKECLFNIGREKVVYYIEKGLIPCSKMGEIPKNKGNQWKDDRWEFDKDKIEALKEGLINEAYTKYFLSEDRTQFSAKVYVETLVKKGKLKTPDGLEIQKGGKQVKVAYADESQSDAFFTFLMDNFIPKQLLVYKASDKKTKENTFIWESCKNFALRQFFQKYYLTPSESPPVEYVFGKLQRIEETDIDEWITNLYELPSQLEEKLVDKPVRQLRMNEIKVGDEEKEDDNGLDEQDDSFDGIKTKNKHKQKKRHERNERIRCKQIQFSEEYIKQNYDLWGQQKRLPGTKEAREVYEECLKELYKDYSKQTSKGKKNIEKIIFYLESILYHDKYPDMYPDPEDHKRFAEKYNCNESRIRQVRQELIRRLKNRFKNLGYFD